MSRYKIAGLPWGGEIGIDVSKCTSSKEVLDKAGLNFNVKKCELVAKMPFSIGSDNTINKTMGDFSYESNIYRVCPNGYATYRTDKNIPLGLVKSKYEVVQNIDAFNFIDNAIGEGKALFETAGCFGYGHKVFITAKLPIETKVGDDPINNYLVFSTSHDGSSSIDILFTPVRVFCFNCLNAGIEESSSHIRIRHTKTVQERLDFGANMLRTAIQYAKSSSDFYESLLTIKMNKDQVKEYIAKLMLTPSEFDAVIADSKNYTIQKIFDRDYLTMKRVGITTRKANILNNVFDYYEHGIAQEHIVGTAWGAYNAITGYYSNVVEMEPQKRMDSLIWGSANRCMNVALNRAYELLNVA